MDDDIRKTKIDIILGDMERWHISIEDLESELKRRASNG